MNPAVEQHLERAQLDLIERLMVLEPPVYLFGGVAEDAVLFGKVSRPRADVDVLVWLDDLPLRVDQAESLGFSSFETRFESAPGTPLVVAAIFGGVDLELIVAQRSIDDRGFFDLPGESGLQRVWLPPDALSHPPQVLEGIVVRTISPLALRQVRAAVAPVFGGLRPKDEVAQQRLRDTFFWWHRRGGSRAARRTRSLMAPCRHRGRRTRRNCRSGTRARCIRGLWDSTACLAGLTGSSACDVRRGREGRPPLTAGRTRLKDDTDPAG